MRPERPARICALSTDPGFACYRLLLDADGNRALLREAVARERDFVPATIAAGCETKVDRQIRSSCILTELGPAATAALRRIVGHARAAPALFGDPLPLRFRVDARILHYDDGDFFAIHRDVTHDAGSGRLVSFVYQFFSEPPAFSGGELRLYGESADADPWVELEPENNLLVVFRPTTPHEVLPVRLARPEFGAGRFAINGWLMEP